MQVFFGLRGSGRWLLLFAGLCRAFAQPLLSPAQVYSLGVTGSEPKFFSLTLQAGTAAHLRLEQLEGDAAVRVSRAGESSRDVDAFDFGVESLTIIADQSGNYRLAIAAVPKNSAARIRLTFVKVAPAEVTDFALMRAEDSSTRAKGALDISMANAAALQLAEDALNQWSPLGNVFAIARTHLQKGSMHLRAGAGEEARADFREARRLCADIANLRCEAEAANNLGLAAITSGEEEAYESLQFASEAWKQLGMLSGESSTRLNLGLLHWQAGEWQDAIDDYERASQLALQLHRPLSLGRILNNEGLVYLSMAVFDQAATYFQRALAIAPNQRGSQRDVGRFWLNLGRARMLAGKFNAALVDLQRAQMSLEAVDDKAGLADVFNNIGQTHLSLKHLQDARRFLGLSLTLYEHSGDRRGQSSALHHLGLVAWEENEPDQARSLLHQALDIRLARRLSDQAADTLYRLAILEQRFGQTDEAIRVIERAIKISESLRTQISGDQLRRAYFANKQLYYEFLIETLMSRHTDADVRLAFAVSERSRGLSFLDSLVEDQAKPAGLDSDFLKRQRSVRRQLVLRSGQLAGIDQKGSDQAGETTLRAQVDELAAEDARMESLIRGNRAVQPFSEQPLLGVEEVQKLLGPKDLVAEYFLGEIRSYLWMISDHSIQAKTLIPRSSMESSAWRVIDRFEDVRARKIDPHKSAEFAVGLRQLARAAGLPFEPPGGFERVVIVPDGTLNRVPFAALPATDSPPGGALGVQYELVQVPSASSFKILRERRAKVDLHSSSVAVFADPVFEDSPSRRLPPGEPELPSSLKLRLPRLPYSQMEVEAIEKVVPPSRLMVKRRLQATRSAFLDASTWRASVVLASTHAFSSAQTALSGIVFSTVGGDGQPIDGLVRLFDIYALRIPSSLVVLSACDTASGPQERGEGPLSFARSFLNAGAGGLLAPIAPVDAEASAALVGDFLQRVLSVSGTTPSRALKEVRLKLAKSSRWKDPYYWSSFVLSSSWE